MDLPSCPSISFVTFVVYRRSRLLERVHVDGVPVLRLPDVRSDRAWDLARTSTAQARRHRDVLLPIHGERYRESLDAGTQARFPQHLAGARVEGAEHARKVAREEDAAAGGQR